MRLLASVTDCRGGPVPRLPDGTWRAREEERLCLRVESDGLVSAFLAGERLAVLEESQSPAGILRVFALDVGTWAGRSRVRLTSGGSQVGSVALDVSPRDDKLGAVAYREMLERLTAISKDLPWGLSGGDHGADRDVGSPGVVHPALLESELPHLIDCVERIVREPLSWTERPRALLPFRKNRGVDPAVLQWLLSHPRALRAIRTEEDGQTESPRSVLVEQRQHLITKNHPATRALKYGLLRLVRLLERTAGRLRGREEPRAAELLADVERAVGAITQLVQGRLMGPLRPEPPSETALLSLFDHPLYARANRLLHRLLDPGLHLSEEGALQGALRPSYELFELWVLYDLIARLAQTMGPAWRWSDPGLSRDALLAGPANGAVFEAAGPHGFSLAVHYQRTFHSWTERAQQAEALRTCASLSAQRRPDYILCLSQHGKPVRWVILDAKYRSSRSAVLEGLRDVHVYRDSLRWEGLTASAAFVVVPALHVDADVFSTPAYLDAHRFGALISDSPTLPMHLLATIGLAGGASASPQPAPSRLASGG